uniref:Peptidase domain containing associated with muscle regeneration 1b n=1 Tax=Xiphophorus couchianus TaxID=32473 RepID=A0A3B5MZH0_9TELE
PEWSVMCRGCCEYDVIRCKCPLQGTQVGYAVPCCRNAINECDPCIIHPCSIFENCKRCNNGTWGPQDNFFINGKYCAECRPGWSGGDCMCGGVIRKRQGHLVLESYPNNARCEWTIQVEKRFMMLSLEFHPSCRYDFVEVRDGDSINSRVIGRFCGNNRPAALQSSGNTLHILFVSDGYKNFDGFFATFQENSPVNGDHLLVYGPNDVLIALQYMCNQPYELIGISQRTCLPNNTWSGSPPFCSKPPLPRLYNGYHQVVPGLDLETMEFMCNHSYALSGDKRRTCQPDGTWSGKQPFCLRCREPKVSELVKQKILPPHVPSKTIVHRLLSSAVNQKLQAVGPTKSSPVLPQLSQGFHHLYTHIEYECASQYYHHFGSARRTCLKTGKWSGRHVSCSPAHWPWLAAIYRRSLKETETKVTKGSNQDETLKKDAGDRSSNLNQASDWQLVCSGALVNQRSLVVAAHCVTELGKMYPVDTATIKVVVGKHYRNDRRENKGPQHLRVSSIAVHPNYDPNILDSDIAVIKLFDKARIGQKVLPLCLSENEEEEVTSDQGLVTGWSPLQDSSLGLEEKARVGLVHLADIVPCEHQYARNGVPVSVTDNMLCASQKPDYGPSNICPSDTGGILVLPANSGNQVSYNSKFSQVQKDNRGLWRLLGLVSFGYDQGECDPELYTVYTRVDNFKDWIESNIK